MNPNQDKLEGSINTTVGSFKEGVGRATDNKDLENEGLIQKAKGKAQKLSGALQDVVEKGKDILGIKTPKE
jgi:uncharacterized protein YjbJ (UPF0337 family)